MVKNTYSDKIFKGDLAREGAMSAFELQRKINDGEALTKQALSARLWGIAWDDFLPFHFQESDIYLDTITYKEFSDFIKENSEKIFTENEINSSFNNFDNSKARVTFYEQESDIFAYKIKEKIVGVFVSHPSDWSTYYLRYTNILPAYRGCQLTIRTIAFLSNILFSVGVQRIKTEVSPSNLRQVQRLSKLGFVISGNTLSERWGALLFMTKYLDNQSEQTFYNQFCVGLRPMNNSNLKQGE